MYAEKINHGMAQGLSFQETFGSEASGDLLELRRTFLLKAFQRRQDSLLRHLLAAGHEPAAVLGLSVAALQGLALEAEAARLRARYLDRRPVPAPVTPDARAFVDTDGETLTADQLPSYLKALARVGVNAEFNGAICRGLLAARFAGTAPAGEPTLLDFIRQPPSAHPAI
jgi:hypothetical protein